MQGNIDVLTLIALVVAVVVVIRLRSVLGRRTEDDEARIDRRIRAAREAQERAAAAGDRVVTLPRRDRPANAQPERSPAAASEAAAAEARVKTFPVGDKSVEEALLAIARRDPAFDAGHFMTGAKQAYEMIVTAFAEGDRKMLKDFLSRDVFEGFASAISQRESRHEQVQQSFVGINAAELVEAELKDRIASISVKFVSQLITSTRDREGHVVSGDPQRIQDVTDIWTFSRDVTARDPNWKLVATQAPG